MAAERILVWGATGQAQVVAPMIERSGGEIVLLVDRDPQLSSPVAAPLVRPHELEAWIDRVRPTCFVVAIGGTHGRDRITIARRLESLGLASVTLAHERAWVADSAVIGPGAQICALAAISVGVTVGRQCIVNTSASVDHESSLGDGVHIMPGAVIAGSVRIGDGATVGSNATVLPRVVIGDDAVVGAGAVVVRDVPTGAVVKGVPAR